MTAFIAAWLLVNFTSLAVLTYATIDATRDYRAATRLNGLRRRAARMMLRSQAVRLLEVLILLIAALLAAAWPAAPVVETRPAWVTSSVRGALMLVVVLIAASSTLDVVAKRRILRRTKARL